MPVRIYALAKELKIDSKELVDICAKAGIPGKGSALASLTDEEVVKLREYLSGKNKKTERPPAPDPVPIPPSRHLQDIPRKPQEIPRPKPRPVAPVVKEPVPEVPAPVVPPTPVVVEPTVVVETPAPVAKAPVETPPPAPVKPAAPVKRPLEKSPGVLRREDYIAPGGGFGRPPALGQPPRGGDRSSRQRTEGTGDRPRPPQRSGPSIKLAPLPAGSAQLPKKDKAKEPTPQKPDLRLPADAIRASKAGSKPLADHLRKHEQKRKAELAGKESGAATPAPTGTQGVRDRGKRGIRADEDTAALGASREARQLSRKKSAARRRVNIDDDENQRYRRGPRRQKRSGSVNTAAPRKSLAVLEFPCTVRSFSEAIGVPVKQVLGRLLALGTMKTINAELDPETAELLAVELGVEIEIRRSVDVQEQFMTSFEDQVDRPDQLLPRPPVVTVLGHVDHGKTSLLDRIIGINVVSGESGGITQHIRSYQVDHKGQKISFVDTPGHEAFTAMRARGANVTDIAILVVAANDGVMPQTEEAISHARAAGVPIVVALNKIDLPGVDIQKVYQQLAVHELLPTEWGGDTELVKTSALTGEGIDDLLETLLTIAELQDYRANPERDASGTCMEASLHDGRGVVVNMIVQNGTLRVGDAIVCGDAYGRVKQMYNTLNPNQTLKEAGPSTPVSVTGLDIAPSAGEAFYVVSDISQARELAELRQQHSRATTLGSHTSHVTLENLYEHLGAQEVRTLNVILRADVRGSIEAIQKELEKLQHDEVRIKTLMATVGGISEADVHLADASDAIIIGFNVVPDDGARSLADERGVQIRRYDIIYKVSEDLKSALEGMLKPEEREAELGRALIQRTFTISRIGTIAGCRVLSGNILRNARVRIIRDNRIIGDYAIDSLKREKDDVRDVREGLECGIKLSGYNDLKEGDILEAYRIEEVARTF